MGRTVKDVAARVGLADRTVHYSRPIQLVSRHERSRADYRLYTAADEGKPRIRLAAAAFGLNLAWEVGHWPLYECKLSPVALGQAAAVDAALTVAMAETAGLARRRSARAQTLVLGMGLGAIALAIEMNALRRGRRFYAATMPTVAEVGVSPLIQLPLLGLLAVRISGAGLAWHVGRDEHRRPGH